MRLIKATLILAGLALLATPALAVTLNEIRIDQTSTDNQEYFELLGTPGESLGNLTYIVIGDGTGASGVIESVTSLAGKSIGADGYFLGVETSYGTPVCGDTPDAIFGTTLNFENSDNVTHLLVADFTGANAQDLDTNDDGVLDSTPWSGIIDDVAVLYTATGGDKVYSTTLIGPDGIYAPGLILICDGYWVIGDFDLCIHDTPGVANTNACEVPSEDTSFGSLKSLFR
jgi:hypothetical protein